MTNRLRLKNEFSNQILLDLKFVDQGRERFDYCLSGYLAWISYDCKTRLFNLHYSTSDFHSYTDHPEGRNILEILTNKSDFYIQNGYKFNHKFEEVLELVSYDEDNGGETIIQ